MGADPAAPGGYSNQACPVGGGLKFAGATSLASSGGSIPGGGGLRRTAFFLIQQVVAKTTF